MGIRSVKMPQTLFFFSRSCHFSCKCCQNCCKLWSISRVLKKLFLLIFAGENCQRSIFTDIILSASYRDSFLFPQEKTLGTLRQEPSGWPGETLCVLSVSFSRAVKRDVRQRYSQGVVLPKMAHLCALPRGNLKTERGSFQSQHPLKQQLSNFFSTLRNCDAAHAAAQTHLFTRIACGTKTHLTRTTASGTHS